jgi:aquaporin Z
MINYLVEFIGTFVFLSIILNVAGKSAMAPLFIGLGLTAAILLGGHISGGHFNPAVSTMMLLKKSLSLNDYVPYVAAQLLGGVAAYYFLQLSNKK